MEKVGHRAQECDLQVALFVKSISIGHTDSESSLFCHSFNFLDEGIPVTENFFLECLEIMWDLADIIACDNLVAVLTPFFTCLGPTD